MSDNIYTFKSLRTQLSNKTKFGTIRWWHLAIWRSKWICRVQQIQDWTIGNGINFCVYCIGVVQRVAYLLKCVVSSHSPSLCFLNDQCSKLPVAYSARHWRLTFRVGDHQLATWSPKKKKKRKIEQSRIFRKEGGQIGSEHSFFHSSASVWLGGSGIPLPPRTKHGSRNSHLPRVYARCYSYRAVQCRACAAGAFHMCGCKIDNRETKLHHLPIHNSKADLRSYIATSRKKADGSRADILFLSVSVRSRARHG